MNTVLRRWKKHFEKLINEENNSESRTNKGKRFGKCCGLVRRSVESYVEDEEWKGSWSR